MTVDETRAVMEAYLDGHDANVLAEDAVFHDTASGEDIVGRAAIAAMLEDYYHRAFEAHSETRNLIITEGAAVLEADFVGTHIAAFNGIPASGRQVRVPLCVTYRLADGAIREATVYLQVVAMLEQLGVLPRVPAEA